MGTRASHIQPKNCHNAVHVQKGGRKLLGRLRLERLGSITIMSQAFKYSSIQCRCASNIHVCRSQGTTNVSVCAGRRMLLW